MSPRLVGDVQIPQELHPKALFPPAPSKGLLRHRSNPPVHSGPSRCAQHIQTKPSCAMLGNAAVLGARAVPAALTLEYSAKVIPRATAQTAH